MDPPAMPGVAGGDAASRRFTVQGEIDGVFVRPPPDVFLLACAGRGPGWQARSAARVASDSEEREALLSIGHPFFAQAEHTRPVHAMAVRGSFTALPGGASLDG